MDKKIDFDNIVEEYYELIYSYVYRMIDNISDAQDLTQDIFIKIKKNLYKYDENKATIKTWIYRIATNHVINFTKVKRHYLLDNIETVKSTDDVLMNLLEEEKHRVVVNAIVNNLVQKHRRIMLLYIFSELSPKEISLSLSIPIKTVYNAIYLSVEKIKKILEV